MIKHPILKNHADIDSIEWKYLDKETYVEIENILTNGVTFFEPFLVDNFYPKEMFDELVEVCNSYDLKKMDYSNQMNKWEEGVEIPQKFIDYAVQKIKRLTGINDINFGYHMYAHHQITSDGRKPKLPLHIDWAPGAYMIDLHIGGNRDWSFVARYSEFVCKPNQAIICQPQFDYHYRPSWDSENPKDFYQAIFFHLVNKNHWSRKTEFTNRSKDLDNKYIFGSEFRDMGVFAKFQNQRHFIFYDLYLNNHKNFNLSAIPLNELPSKSDQSVHDRKGIEPTV
jgi:hypothetical protein